MTRIIAPGARPPYPPQFHETFEHVTQLNLFSFSKIRQFSCARRTKLYSWQKNVCRNITTTIMRSLTEHQTMAFIPQHKKGKRERGNQWEGRKCNQSHRKRVQAPLRFSVSRKHKRQTVNLYNSSKYFLTSVAVGCLSFSLFFSFFSFLFFSSSSFLLRATRLHGKLRRGLFLPLPHYFICCLSCLFFMETGDYLQRLANSLKTK